MKIRLLKMLKELPQPQKLDGCFRAAALSTVSGISNQLLESSSMHIHYCKSIENAVTSWAYLLRLAESQFYTNTSAVAKTAGMCAAVG